MTTLLFDVSGKLLSPFVKVVLKILGHAPILILVIHFLLGWVAAVYEFTKGLDARVQAKTYDL